jgi:hypothetical protein
MPVLAVDLALVRDVLLPDLRLTIGRAMMARVVTPGTADAKGTLSIAGYLLDAELPRGLRAGQELRLEVRDMDAHRVLLGISERPEHAEPQAQAPPPHSQQVPGGWVPLPGGATLRIVEDQLEQEQGGGADRRDGESRTVALRLDGAALGAIDLRLQLSPDALRVDVALAPGAPMQAATADADALHAALLAGADRAVSVTVSPRHDPLDLYA